MELQKLQRVTIDALEDIKAHDIKVFDTLGQSSEFDRVIVATGNSNRQTRALAWNVVQKVKENGGRVVSVEGTDTGEWVLVDLGDVVVHIMQPTIRQYYGLEELWGTKPVRLKRRAAKRIRAASAAPAPEMRKKITAKSGRGRTAASAKSVGKAVKKSAKRIANSGAKKTARSAPAKPPAASLAKSPKTAGQRPARASGTSTSKSTAKAATKAATKASSRRSAKVPTKVRAAARPQNPVMPKTAAGRVRSSPARGATARPAKKA